MMAEYIEREVALEAAKKSHLYFDIKPIINSIPAADVRPVKRGKWTKEHLASTTGGTYPVVRCSVCGASLPFFEGTTYCPNCWSDMRPKSMPGANGEGI